tara:strand:+ start:221 stop:625 length:405 start_codon:yes stop_codon:yes gene_type:complete
MDPELIRALSFFVAGALAHAVLSRFFTQVWFMVFAKDMLHMFLKMLGALSVEIATARAAKYQALEEGDYTEQEIDAVKVIDKVTDASWKMALINALINSFPKRYRHLVTFYDWDGAMKVLQDIYSRERKRYEKK